MMVFFDFEYSRYPRSSLIIFVGMRTEVDRWFLLQEKYRTISKQNKKRTVSPADKHIFRSPAPSTINNIRNIRNAHVVSYAVSEKTNRNSGGGDGMTGTRTLSGRAYIYASINYYYCTEQ